MFQGTGSDVGKSLIVAGLARALTRRGLAVRPFKPQNMSNNAAVTRDGGEIGRAQALQARACRVGPTTDMNPVLLKPQSEIGAQIVVQGRMTGSSSARDYAAVKPRLMAPVLESFARLCSEADIVLVEGAGSPAEVNLRQGDIANMGFAEAADVPVILIGDIDRGGVIAAIAGTHALIEPAERARLKGYVINKFRGDVSLFDGAIDILRERTGLACHGVIPFWPGARDLPPEDGVALDRGRYDARHGDDSGARPIKIAVPRLPMIANFDDLDPLAAEPGVLLDVVTPGRALPGDADLVLLPGSKATLADLASLRREGWDIDIAAHVRRGGHVLGVCGGYQMLGRRVADPGGIEGKPGEADGLGLIDVETVLTGNKTLVETSGADALTGAAVHGYEMHVGRTTGEPLARPMLRLADGRDDGAMSADGRVSGCYLHGLFASDAYRRQLLARLGGRGDPGLDWEARIDAALDGLADHLERHLDVPALLEIARAR